MAVSPVFNVTGYYELTVCCIEQVLSLPTIGREASICIHIIFLPYLVLKACLRVGRWIGETATPTHISIVPKKY